MCYSDAAGDKCWIGLYKSASDTPHFWLDGNPSTYRNWQRGEPNSPDDQCVYIHDGTYRDKICSHTYRYVCKGIYYWFASAQL